MHRGFSQGVRLLFQLTVIIFLEDSQEIHSSAIDNGKTILYNSLLIYVEYLFINIE